jgi:hypothetical protein
MFNSTKPQAPCPTDSVPVARAIFSDTQLLVEGYVHEDDITVDAIISLVRSAEEHGEASIGTFGDRKLQWRIVLPVADGSGAAQAAIEYLEKYLTLKRGMVIYKKIGDYIEKGAEDVREKKPWTPQPFPPPYTKPLSPPPYEPSKTWPGTYPGEPYITD